MNTSFSLTGARKITERVFLYVVVILMVIVFCFPIYWMINTSLAQSAEIYNYPPQFTPSKVSLDAYTTIFENNPVSTWMINSFQVVLLSTAYSLLVSLPGAYALSRMRSRASTSAGFFLLVTRMVPATLLVIPIFILFGKLGLTNSLPGLAIAYSTFSIPFSVWMLKGFFDSIPRDLEEAAQIDGCSEVDAIVRVVAPLTLPGISATAIYCFILGWGEFLFARTFISKDALRTISVGIAYTQREFSVDWSEMFAMAVISIIPVVIAFLFLERYLVTGLTAGAVKG